MKSEAFKKKKVKEGYSDKFIFFQLIESKKKHCDTSVQILRIPLISERLYIIKRLQWVKSESYLTSEQWSKIIRIK